MYARMKIMIAFDGSPRAEMALRDLRYAGLPRLAEAKLVSVVESLVPAGPPDAALGRPIIMMLQRETQAANWAVRHGIAKLHKTFPDWAFDMVVRFGNTVRQVIVEAEEWKPELIFISPLNRSQFERLFFGSFARSVVETAPCSVRVARAPTPGEERGLRLLLGYDGSRGAAAAICEIALRHWPPHTEVHLVVVNNSSFMSNFTRRADARTLPDELLHGAADFLCEAGLRVSLVRREGSPKQVLLEEAAQWGAHCIFLGRSQRRAMNQFLLSSTSAAIAAQAHCTVEVVHEGAQRLARARRIARPQAWKIAAQSAAH